MRVFGCLAMIYNLIGVILYPFEYWGSRLYWRWMNWKDRKNK